MARVVKWIGIVVGAIALIVAAFVWIVAPLRARRLDQRYARFRAEHQAEHDAIDAGFQHEEREVNGLQWHWVEAGSPEGPLVLFLHGLPEGWYSWRYVLPTVDQGFRLVAIDMKGYGRSDLRDRDFDWHHVASRIMELVDSLGARKLYVVGHDWGALIGSVLVADHPERILGFVRMEADLVPKRGSTAATYAQKPQWLLFQSRWIATFLMRDPGWLIDLVYGSRMQTRLSPEDRDYLVYEFSRPGVAEVNPLYFRRGNWAIDTALGSICRGSFPFPILALQADQDPAQPRELFATVATECPNVRLQWITDSGHFDNFDQPDQVAAAINGFLKQAEANQARSP
jgi:epoxide hydrolase 4